MNVFSDRVEALRKAKGLTVGEVLEEIGISAPMMSMIKAGRRNPGIKTIRRLMESERAVGIVPPEDYALPKEELDKIEYGIPMDPKDMMVALKEIQRLIKELKQDMAELKKQKGG